MTDVLARWLRRGVCPVCGEPARRGQATCGDPLCEQEHRRSTPPRPTEHWLALTVGLVGGLLMGGVIGYTTGTR